MPVLATWPVPSIVEHINRKRSDNRLVNLKERRATRRRAAQKTRAERDAYLLRLWLNESKGSAGDDSETATRRVFPDG